MVSYSISTATMAYRASFIRYTDLLVRKCPLFLIPLLFSDHVRVRVIKVRVRIRVGVRVRIQS